MNNQSHTEEEPPRQHHHRHPLSMSFGDYLSTLSEHALTRRLGNLRVSMLKEQHNGNTKSIHHYIAPLPCDRYSLSELKRDDANAFAAFFSSPLRREKR